MLSPESIVFAKGVLSGITMCKEIFDQALQEGDISEVSDSFHKFSLNVQYDIILHSIPKEQMPSA